MAVERPVLQAEAWLLGAEWRIRALAITHTWVALYNGARRGAKSKKPVTNM